MMYLPVLLLSLVWLPVTSPADLEHRIALAVAVTADPGTTPHEARILMRIPRWEANYRPEVSDCRITGDAGRSVGSWQAHDRAPEVRARICADLAYGALVARADVRRSYAMCAHLPEPERLAGYTRGKCDNEEARRLSRTRWWP